MSSRSLGMLIGLGGALGMLAPMPAEAQIIRRFRGGGVQVRAPLVRVNVGPYGGTSVRAPFVAVDPGGVRVGLRQRLAPIYQPVVPQVRPPVAANGYSGTLSDRGYVPFPTAEELLAMDDRTLFTTLNDLFHALDARLSRLTTGAGWQRHLLVPSRVLNAPAANLDELQQTLARFDAVADNPEYAKIAGLPSFIATKAALRQTVLRFNGPRIVNPSADEVLPTPTQVAEPEATRGEHSIIKSVPSN